MTDSTYQEQRVKEQERIGDLKLINRTQCKYCGAECFWAVGINGNKLLMDYSPSNRGNYHVWAHPDKLHAWPDTSRGDHTCHFATCKPLPPYELRMKRIKEFHDVGKVARLG